MSKTEDELRDQLEQTVKALDRIRDQFANVSVERDQLQADLLYALQGVSTWTEAAVKRTQERDAARARADKAERELAVVRAQSPAINESLLCDICGKRVAVVGGQCGECDVLTHVLDHPDKLGELRDILRHRAADNPRRRFDVVDIDAHNKKYPCSNCGTLRSKAEGGDIFTVCDACWDKKPCAECGRDDCEGTHARRDVGVIVAPAGQPIGSANLETPVGVGGIFDAVEAAYGREAREQAVQQTIGYLRAVGESADPLPSVRGVVLRFAIEMERTLRDNDDKGGWDEEDLDDLLDNLKDEVKELSRVVAGDDSGLVDADRVRAEAVDVANFAMMLADRSSRMGKGLPADLRADLDAVLGRSR